MVSLFFLFKAKHELFAGAKDKVPTSKGREKNENIWVNIIIN